MQPCLNLTRIYTCQKARAEVPWISILKKLVMKLRNVILSGVLCMALFGCNETDSKSYTTETMLKINIPTKSYLSTQNQTPTTYHFSGIRIFCLAYSDYLENCPGDIVRINPAMGSYLSFNSLHTNETITELKVILSYKTQSDATFNPLQTIDLISDENYLSNETHTVVLDNLLTPLIKQLNINPRYLISIEINGSSNFNLESDAQLAVPLSIESEYNGPRFTL